MMYHLNTRSRTKGPSLLIVSIAGSVVFLFAIIFGSYNGVVQEFLSPVTHIFLKPTLFARNFATNVTTAITTPFSDVEILRQQNEELLKEHENYGVLLLERDLLVKENISLKASLGRRADQIVIRGTVIAAPDKSPYDTLLIDIGKDHGIKLNQEVISENSVIGRIAEVYGKSSLVKLLSSPGEEHDVRIGDAALLGRATGLGGGNFEVTLPRSLDIRAGDAVVIPSLSVRIFGVVGAAGLGSSETFQRILFGYPFNIHTVTSVDVVVE